MYSWGDDTFTWKKPGAYDFGDAKKAYISKLGKEAEDKGPRTYFKKKEPNLEIVNPKNRIISTESENPVIVAVDGTGSMASWPAEIFDRLPLLYQTLSKYRDGIEISFSVIGDAISDQWPAQVTDFGKGVTLDDYLIALQPEGGGGPGIRESYELWAYFMKEHAKTPKAKSPFMIIMGDEKFYETIHPKQIEHYLGDKIAQSIDSKEVWKELSDRFDIYLLRKSYEGRDKEIEEQWTEAIGKQKIIPIYDPTRIVDVATGIIAKTWGEFGDFQKSLSARQDPENIEKVMKSLKLVEGAKTPSKVLGGSK